MIRHLVTLLGIVSLTYFTACGGGDDSSKPPPKPSPIPSAAGGAGCQPPNSGVFSMNTVSQPSPSCVPGFISVDPQGLIDVQIAYNNAKQVCCSTYGPAVAAAVAGYPSPNVGMPQVNSSACDQAIIQAQLVGQLVYAPWGGRLYPPYQQYELSQGKAVISCIGSASGIHSPNDPRIIYVAVAAAPIIRQGVAGPAGQAYTAGLPYLSQLPR